MGFQQGPPTPELFPPSHGAPTAAESPSPCTCLTKARHRGGEDHPEGTGGDLSFFRKNKLKKTLEKNLTSFIVYFFPSLK